MNSYGKTINGQARFAGVKRKEILCCGGTIDMLSQVCLSILKSLRSYCNARLSHTVLDGIEDPILLT